MKAIVAYLIAIAGLDAAGAIWIRYFAHGLPRTLSLVFMCAFLGGIGGALYCLRAVYLNACVIKKWDTAWKPWYFIRPVVSHITGAMSYIFLRAGLLLLEASPSGAATDLGFFALALIAGLNVDKFVSKIEDIAQASWGIEKYRTSKWSKTNGD